MINHPKHPHRVVRRLLSDTATLRDYLKGELPDAPAVLSRLFLEERTREFDLPDHVLRYWKKAQLPEEPSIGQLLLDGLGGLSNDLLETDHHRIEVRQGQFEIWQDIVALIPVLVLMSRKISGATYGRGQTPDEAVSLLHKWIRPNLSPTLLPAPPQRKLDALCRERGLSDLHLHLNGTTEADQVWLDAIFSPEKWFHETGPEYNKNRTVQEFYNQLEPGLSPQGVHDRLFLAGALRDRLARKIFGVESKSKVPFDALIRNPDRYEPILRHRHPLSEIFPNIHTKSPVEWEALFLIFSFRHMETDPNDRFIREFHLYLLIWGQFQQLLVQSHEQFGFDQFNKVAGNEGRELSEKEYTARFHQLAGKGDLYLAEGRFSPKDTPSKNMKLLNRIFLGYAHFHKILPEESPSAFLMLGDDRKIRRMIKTKKRMNLRLIAHFIKRSDEKNTNPDSLKVRHHGLRHDLQKRWHALSATRYHLPLAHHFVTGIDAAASELDAPPEVFAPLYRSCKRAGIRHATFHVGEDFHHLISGIRAIWEAVKFLELKGGNRIGHGTALGIDPELWVERIGSSMVIPEGEWLDNLIFVYDMISREKALSHHHGLLERLRLSIEKRARKIYGETPSISNLIEAWKLRRWDAHLAFSSCKKQTDCLYLKEEVEWEEIDNAEEENKEAFALLKKYHSASYRARFDTLEIIETTKLVDAALLRELQNSLTAMLNEREVVIEAIPTSNLRISYYTAYREHHLWRWLGVTKKEGDVLPIVCLGSDDPGIFSTCIRNEYAHLYETLIHDFDYPHDKAGHILEDLENNARTYAFFEEPFEV